MTTSTENKNEICINNPQWIKKSGEIIALVGEINCLGIVNRVYLFNLKEFVETNEAPFYVCLSFQFNSFFRDYAPCPDDFPYKFTDQGILIAQNFYQFKPYNPESFGYHGNLPVTWKKDYDADSFYAELGKLFCDENVTLEEIPQKVNVLTGEEIEN
jgi:hypothetical protein